MPDKDKPQGNYKAPKPTVSPKYEYQRIDSRTYSVRFREQSKEDSGEPKKKFKSLQNLSLG